MNSPCTHEPLSTAVQRCCDARNHMIYFDRNGPSEGLPEPAKDIDTNLEARVMFQARAMHFLHDHDPSLAYRAAMPEPIGRRQIKQYIACVMHGLAIEAITHEEARNMLYGARIATLAINKRGPNKKPPVSAPATAPTEYEMYVEECRKLGINRT
jgi:hypothetical protein